MKIKLYKLGKYLTKKFCPHENTEEIFRCYQEQCYHDKCKDCGKVIYTGMI